MASNPFYNKALLSYNPHQGHKTLNPPTPLRGQNVPGSMQVNSQSNFFPQIFPFKLLQGQIQSLHGTPSRSQPS